LIVPDRHQFSGIEHDMVSIGLFVWIVDRPLVHVALHDSPASSILAVGDYYPVAAPPHPSH